MKERIFDFEVDPSCHCLVSVNPEWRSESSLFLTAKRDPLDCAHRDVNRRIEVCTRSVGDPKIESGNSIVGVRPITY